ncbi:MAG: GNAT family N-acetyltransferase [Lentimicrobium sp.]|nr:GNAT family N-acetyltransferase [Lentimicrobium sp.]
MQGERLFLRALEPADIDLLYIWENDPAHWAVSNTITPFSRFAIEQYILNTDSDIYSSRQLRLIVCLKDEKNTPIGAIDLFDFDPHHSRAGMGILISAKFRNRGYAREALKIMIEYCRKVLHLHQLYCNIAEDNFQSIRLFEEAGFVKSGTKKDWLKQGENWTDELIFQNINKSLT